VNKENSMTRTDAHDVLQRARTEISVDFHRLSTSQVDSLLVDADAIKYRKPYRANGSRARYFHAYMVRVARREP